MPLTPDEEKKLRQEIRKNLEQHLKREQESKENVDTGRQQKLEERLRQQIREEEEEAFYSDHGFVKYLNHRGGVEWLTPEELEVRHQKRRSKKGSSRRKIRRRNKYARWAVNVAALGLAMVVFLYLWRYNPIKVKKTGSIVIESNVPGAQVFVNGAEKRDILTPDTLPDISAGAYFISIYKDGYTAWPPMQRVSLPAGKTMVAKFELKSTGRMGNVSVQSNISGFDVYVDGVKYPANADKELEIPAGYHVISAVKKGYLANPHYQYLLVEENAVTNVQFNFEQNSDIGYLKVTSNRSSAYIYLSNQFTGIKANGKAIPVKSGVYEIRLQENRFASIPVAEIVTINPEETKSFSFHLKPESRMDTLQLLTPTPGANVILDGKMLPFVTPLMDLALSEGTHFLNLMREGQLYEAKDMQIDLVKFKDKRLVVDF